MVCLEFIVNSDSALVRHRVRSFYENLSLDLCVGGVDTDLDSVEYSQLIHNEAFPECNPIPCQHEMFLVHNLYTLKFDIIDGAGVLYFEFGGKRAPIITATKESFRWNVVNAYAFLPLLYFIYHVE